MLLEMAVLLLLLLLHVLGRCCLGVVWCDVIK